MDKDSKLYGTGCGASMLRRQEWGRSSVRSWECIKENACINKKAHDTNKMRRRYKSHRRGQWHRCNDDREASSGSARVSTGEGDAFGSPRRQDKTEHVCHRCVGSIGSDADGAGVG